MTEPFEPLDEFDQYDAEARLAYLKKIKPKFHDRLVFVHYKGGVYLVLGDNVQHTERGWETGVVYMHLWPHHDTQWKFRPAGNFWGTLEGVDKEISRFRRVNFDAL